MEKNIKEKTLFKYRGDNEWTLKGIRDGELYIAPAEKLNDMFELMPYVNLECFNQIKEANFSSFKIEDATEVEKEIVKNLNSISLLDEVEFFSLFQVYLNKIKSEYGITSLSMNGESPIMWGHYGDEGRGILLEYDMEELKSALTGDLICNEVRYSEVKYDMSDIFLATLSGESNYFQITKDNFYNYVEYCFTKSSDWQYEEELRIISRNLRNKTFKIKPKSITLGGNMLAIDRIKYIELAKELGIELRRADIFNSKSFAIKSLVYTDEEIAETYRVAEEDKHIDIDLILQLLSSKRPVFYSEADFQFAFAKEVELLYPSASVRLEYISNKIKGMHIDIWVSLHGYVIPIELKYKTKEASISYNNEQFDLKSHSANNLGMYDVIRDIERVEKVKKIYDNCREGYVICITNDQGYYKKRNIDGRVQYEDFCISQDKLIPKYPRWKLDPSPGTIKGRIKEINSTKEYTCNWNDYSHIEEIGFKSIVFKVDNT